MSSQIIERVELPDEAGSIVLYDWILDDMTNRRNLVKVDREGGVIWRATPPTTGLQDCFTRIRWDGQALAANTWSGYRVNVDLQNGTVTALEFVNRPLTRRCELLGVLRA